MFPFNWMGIFFLSESEQSIPINPNINTLFLIEWEQNIFNPMGTFCPGLIE